MTYWYDGQIRRYLTQIIRMLSNFKYKTTDGQEIEIPALYGNMSRQVAAIIRQNSENTIVCAPRWAIYITDLQPDRTRTRDSTFVEKTHIRERAYDNNGNEYLNYQGKNYTVEKLMPTPYIMKITADIWTTNTDQKLQIFEQVMGVFNPSLEIQTTDNFVDWTSLTTVTLESMTFSSRSIPQGIDSEIDIGTFIFDVPIWISLPVKVKRLGIITNIISSIYDERAGTIDLSESLPQLNRNNDSQVSSATDSIGGRIAQTNENKPMANVNYGQYGIYVDGNTVKLSKNGLTTGVNWRQVLDLEPGIYQSGISRIYIQRQLGEFMSFTGTFVLNPYDESEITVTWDSDTFPDDTAIVGPARNAGSYTSIDYIIDPTRINPTNLKISGLRILILEDIGNEDNTDGADAWKNNDNSDFVAGANDIIEWSGSAWVIVYDASDNLDIDEAVYTTNLNTGIQYRWDGVEWLHSVDGLYPVGTWRLSLEG